MPNDRDNGCENYQIVHWPTFEQTYKKLVKKHYGRNKFLEQFRKLVDEYLDRLSIEPCSSDFQLEPWPDNCFVEDCQLRKIRWKKLPGLKSAARFGRLIYLIHHPTKTVYLLWIYTHAEYSKRPENSELRKVINAVKEEIEKSDNNSE